MGSAYFVVVYNMFFWYTLLYTALHTAITASFSCCSHKAGVNLRDKIRATLLHMASLEGVNDEEKDYDDEENKTKTTWRRKRSSSSVLHQSFISSWPLDQFLSSVFHQFSDSCDPDSMTIIVTYKLRVTLHTGQHSHFLRCLSLLFGLRQTRLLGYL